MAESHVVSGLVAKRSELSGRINLLQNEIDSIRSTLVHIDQSIKLFDPDYDLRTIKGKRTNNRNVYLKHGEAQRLSLDVLRTANKPMTSRDIVNEIIKHKELEYSPEMVQTMQRLTLGSLHNMVKRGIVKSAKNEDGGRSQIRFCIG